MYLHLYPETVKNIKSRIRPTVRSLTDKINMKLFKTSSRNLSQFTVGVLVRCLRSYSYPSSLSYPRQYDRYVNSPNRKGSLTDDPYVRIDRRSDPITTKIQYKTSSSTPTLRHGVEEILQYFFLLVIKDLLKEDLS